MDVWDPPHGMYRVSFLYEPTPIKCQWLPDKGYFNTCDGSVLGTAPYQTHEPPETGIMYPMWQVHLAVWAFDDKGRRLHVTRASLEEMYLVGMVMHHYQHQDYLRLTHDFPIANHDYIMEVDKRYSAYPPLIRTRPTPDSVPKNIYRRGKWPHVEERINTWPEINIPIVPARYEWAMPI